MNEINFDDLNLFEKFIKTTNFNHKKYYYILYFIGSPIYIYKESKKNDAYLPLYILILNKKDNTDYKTKILHINWHSIHYFQTFTYITEENTSQRLENIDKYRAYFKEEEIEINPNNIKLKYLKDIKKEGFYKNLTLNSKLEKEVFYEVESNNRKYIIPGIEIVRYFYAKAEHNSLLNSLLHAEGIALLYNSLNISKSEYRLHLKNDCNKDDGIYTLYFVHDDNLTTMYNEIYTRIINKKYLFASFPSNETFTIACRTFLHKDTSLIFKILDSTIHDKLSDKKINIIHPNDKNTEKGISSKKPSKPKKIDTDPENDFDDDIDSIPTADEFTVIEKESSSLNKKELDIEFIKDTTSKSEPKRRTNYEKSQEKKITPNINKNKGKGTKTNLKTELYPNNFDEELMIEYFNSIDKIKKIFEKKYNYNSIVKSYYFPDKKLSNNKLRKVNISYTDKEKNKKRKYLLIKFESDKYKNFFFLDIEKDKDEQKKPILIIKKDIDIKKCQKKYITKIIYDQVNKGNHKWLSTGTHGIKENEYFTFDHKYNRLEDLCKRIYSSVN